MELNVFGLFWNKYDQNHRLLQPVNDLKEIRQLAQSNNFGGGATGVQKVLKLSQCETQSVFGLFKNKYEIWKEILIPPTHKRKQNKNILSQD